MDIRNVVRGDTVDQLLRYVNIDPSVIRENYQRIVSHPALDDGPARPCSTSWSWVCKATPTWKTNKPAACSPSVK